MEKAMFDELKAIHRVNTELQAQLYQQEKVHGKEVRHLEQEVYGMERWVRSKKRKWREMYQKEHAARLDTVTRLIQAEKYAQQMEAQYNAEIQAQAAAAYAAAYDHEIGPLNGPIYDSVPPAPQPDPAVPSPDRSPTPVDIPASPDYTPSCPPR